MSNYFHVHVFFLITFGLKSSNESHNIIKRIVGGNEVSSKSQFPFVANLLVHLKDSKPDQLTTCTGSLVRENFVLTSCKCVTNVNYVVIILGHITLSDNYSSLINITHEFYTHPCYDPYNSDSFRFDLALIQLQNPVLLSESIKVIELPSNKEERYVGNKGTVVGWGQSDPKKLTKVLLFASMEILSEKKCRSHYKVFKEYGKEDMLLCVLGEQQMICGGDSGAPLIYTDTKKTTIQIGIASFDTWNCISPKYPQGFVSVASHLVWINNTMNRKKAVHVECNSSCRIGRLQNSICLTLIFISFINFHAHTI